MKRLKPLQHIPQRGSNTNGNNNSLPSESYSFFYHQLTVGENNSINNFLCWSDLNDKYHLTKCHNQVVSLTFTPHQFLNGLHWNDQLKEYIQTDTLFLSYGVVRSEKQQFAQIIQYITIILKHLKTGGNCIFKVDLLNDLSIRQLIYFVSLFFVEPFIIDKPESSNLLNQCRFIILRNFAPISKKRALNFILELSRLSFAATNFRDEFIPLRTTNYINESNTIIGASILNHTANYVAATKQSENWKDDGQQLSWRRPKY